MNLVPRKELNLQQIQAEEIQFNVMLKRSEVLARSSIIPSSLRGKAADILIIMMMAQELDIPPLQALNGINVIQGKPVISPQLMIALIRSKMPNSFIEIVESEDACTCSMCRDKADKEQIYKSTWTIERAEKMGLASKDNWKKQAATMLKWRAVGDCARVVFPDILSGLYFPDEFQDGTYEITPDGELLGKAAVTNKPVTKVDDISKGYREFREKISVVTNKGTDKEKLERIKQEFKITSWDEVKTYTEEQLDEMTLKLDDFKD